MNISKPWIAYHTKGETHGLMNPVRVVLHDTEGHDAAGISDIEAVWDFWAKQDEGYNVHFIVDAEGLIGQGASIHAVCWHVGGLNTGSIGIEQIGYASFARLVWSKKRRKQMIAVAHLLAWLHTEIGLPLSVPKTVSGAGVVTHAMVSAVYSESMGHTDPGKNYPLGFVLWLARRMVRLGYKKAVS